MIEAEGLGARVGEFELRDVSFVVPAGKYGVVIGAAGSGKTTLLETIAGIIPLRGGVLKLGGADVAGVPPERRDTGIVYQHGYLFPHLSVGENVRYGAADVAFADAMAKRIGASELYAREVRGLSGGERQLVAIARALAPKPRVLLLDEPFSALDPRRRTLVRREVRAIARELGITVLQVTHDFTEAGLLGDVAILIDAGRVLQSGPPERLFREPASPYIAEFLGAENVYAGSRAPSRRRGAGLGGRRDGAARARASRDRIRGGGADALHGGRCAGGGGARGDSRGGGADLGRAAIELGAESVQGRGE